MNANDSKYTRHSLCNEMLQSVEVIRNFQLAGQDALLDSIKQKGKVFLAGEGSSRLFPAKNAIYSAMRAGLDLHICTDGSRQACEYDLTDFVVLGVSNSGMTNELIWLFKRLNIVNHKMLFGLTSNPDSILSKYAYQTFLLGCGSEKAVAATKSVVEQGLFYLELFAQYQGYSLDRKLGELAGSVKETLNTELPPNLIEQVANAETIYFAGRNDGVAEELALKANEIVGKKSVYLEGTSLFHGVEEVMQCGDVVIVVNPFASEIEKYREVVEGAEAEIIAISDSDTTFPTIKVADVGQLQNFVYLAAGWNLLVEVGLYLDLNIDIAKRARKIGNEYEGY